jgi:hypothetical protein
MKKTKKLPEQPKLDNSATPPDVKYRLEQLAFSKYLKTIEDNNWLVNPRFEKEFVRLIETMGANPIMMGVIYGQNNKF